MLYDPSYKLAAQRSGLLERLVNVTDQILNQEASNEAVIGCHRVDTGKLRAQTASETEHFSLTRSP
jgi:hypothetical protein